MASKMMAASLMIVLITCGLAPAYYNQSLGRWTSEDPLGTDPAGALNWNYFGPVAQYGNGVGLYEYVVGCPVSYLDAIGLDAKAPADGKYKCFCVDRVKIAGRKSAAGEFPFFGANLTVTLSGRWIDWCKHEWGWPKFQWREQFTTRPDGTGYAGLTPGGWYNMYARWPDNGVFTDSGFGSRIQNGYVFKDKAGYWFNNPVDNDWHEQDIKFNVIAESPAECCKNTGQQKDDKARMHYKARRPTLGAYVEEEEGSWVLNVGHY